MPDNVKKVLAVSLRRLMRPLVRIMLREGFTYSNFAAIARMAFIDCAAKDFETKGHKASPQSVSAFTGIPIPELRDVLRDQEEFEHLGELVPSNPFARVLHAWHNDKDYVGPYGFPIDLPFEGPTLSVTALTARHAPGVSPFAVVKELRRMGALTEVGANIWKPLVQEYIDPSLSAENIKRLAGLVESLFATMEKNTRARESRDGSELFERTMIVDSPLTKRQFIALQDHLKTAGAQFLQRIDSFAAVDLHENMPAVPDEIAEIRAGLQCFLYVESEPEDRRLVDVMESADFSS